MGCGGEGRSLRDRATPRERALIDAIAVRYVKEFRAERRMDQDRAYADAMKEVSEQFPDDLEIPRSTPMPCSCSSHGAARAT